MNFFFNFDKTIYSSNYLISNYDITTKIEIT